jgi:DNA (cytosine-5)-methyltransferase 1
MNVLSLFSGIGGFSLGLGRAGMRTVAFCEIEPYCRAVLRQHWPDVPIFDDVQAIDVHEGWLVANSDARHKSTEEQLQAGRTAIRTSIVDVICGGFPCQDISIAGKGEGIAGSRSGLWKEFARIIGEVRPRYVVVENVSALLGRGLGDVLGDLAALGYDAEWHCIPASAVGAPHRRDRVWIVAYPGRIDRDGRSGECGEPETAGIRDWSTRPGQHAIDVADASSAERGSLNSALRRYSRNDRLPQGQESPSGLEPGSQDVAYTNRPDVEGQWLASRIQAERDSLSGAGWWLVEPHVGRVAHGVPARVDRLKALGNTIVPQIAEIIGRAIMKMEHPNEKKAIQDQTSAPG